MAVSVLGVGVDEQGAPPFSNAVRGRRRSADGRRFKIGRFCDIVTKTGKMMRNCVATPLHLCLRSKVALGHGVATG